MTPLTLLMFLCQQFMLNVYNTEYFTAWCICCRWRNVRPNDVQLGKTHIFLMLSFCLVKHGNSDTFLSLLLSPKSSLNYEIYSPWTCLIVSLSLSLSGSTLRLRADREFLCSIPAFPPSSVWLSASFPTSQAFSMLIYKMEIKTVSTIFT